MFNRKIDKINELIHNNITGAGIRYITAIMNGKKNLGEYYEFRKKIKEYYLSEKLWFFSARRLYQAIDEYMEITLNPSTRPHIFRDEHFALKALKKGAEKKDES